MLSHFRPRRRAALLLAFLTLLALGTVALVPAASASSPYLRVSKVDDHTLRVEGSGFTPNGYANLGAYNVGNGQDYVPYYTVIRPSPYSFWCDRYRCYSSGGAFTYFIYNIPCGVQLTIQAVDRADQSDAWPNGWSNTVYASSCSIR